MMPGAYAVNRSVGADLFTASCYFWKCMIITGLGAVNRSAPTDLFTASHYFWKCRIISGLDIGNITMNFSS
jgi:hypothetical protein